MIHKKQIQAVSPGKNPLGEIEQQDKLERIYQPKK